MPTSVPRSVVFRYYSFGLEKSRAEDFQRHFFSTSLLAPSGITSIRDLFHPSEPPFGAVGHYLQLEGRDAEELDALQAHGNGKEIRAMRMSWAEQLKNEGREQGVEMGREQGVRQTLLRQLGVRFGPLSDDVKRRVEAIHSIERLNQIAEQILVAHSLEEVGLR
jgi:hypothetical protein